MKGVTKYQLEILVRMREISAGSGRLADFDQILEQLSWMPTKDSAQFTVRALIRKGLMAKCPLEHRRGRLRVCYDLTASGRLLFDPRTPMPAESEMTETEAGILAPGVVPMPGLEGYHI